VKDFGILRNGGFSKPQLLKACGAFGVIMSLTFLALYYGAKAYG
jgi:hypothetical protein